MLNKLSFKFSWRALCLSIAVGTLLFTSCSMYKAGMENADAGDGPQTPVTATSMDLQSTWRSMTLK